MFKSALLYSNRLPHLALLCAITYPAAAQLFESQHGTSGPAVFSPAEQAVLDRLNSLQTLPDGPWHFHAGDLPHGESSTLDDSSWPLMQAKSKAGREAVWYRRTIQIPPP